MIARVALSLAWSAALALLAYPAQAQIIGQQSGIMGGEAGFLAPSGTAAASTVTLDAMPYERTVTCSDYTVTGTWTGSAPTTWTASPSGDSGACSDTGGGTFSCVVDVAPDASGEGVETITIGDQTVTIGFYVDGEHSCFLSQSVDGSYNSGVADLDAVATWTNLGSSAKNVTQGTGAAQPTLRTGIVDDQPMVRCDGGDRVAAATAADWTFLHNGTDWTIDAIAVQSQSNPNNQYAIASTANAVSTTSIGTVFFGDDRSSVSFNDRLRTLIVDNSGGAPIDLISVDDVWPAQKFSLVTSILDDDGGAGVDAYQYCNGSACGTASQSGGYSASAPNQPLNLCALGAGTLPLTGDVFRVLIYQSALTSTQRAINQAVDEWALGSTLPVAPPTLHLDSSYLASVTTASSTVTSWRSTGIITTAVTEATNPPTHSGTGSTAQVDFDGTNDKLAWTATLTPTASAWHVVAVVTPDAVDTNGTGASCYVNDAAWQDSGGYRGLNFRSSAGTTYAIAYNYDGSADCAETTITLGAKQVLDASLSGGNVRIGVNGGSLTTTASGNTSVSTTAGNIGADYVGSRFFDGKIHELLVYPAALSSGDRTTLIDSLKTKWGI